MYDTTSENRLLLVVRLTLRGGLVRDSEWNFNERRSHWLASGSDGREPLQQDGDWLHQTDRAEQETLMLASVAVQAAWERLSTSSDVKYSDYCCCSDWDLALEYRLEKKPLAWSPLD
eukprot:6492795-Amphidinium_carterae.5